MRRLALCASSALLCAAATACPSGHTSTRAETPSVASAHPSSDGEVPTSESTADDKPRYKSPWPEGTFLVINGQPISRDIWDARWQWRETRVQPPPPKKLNEQRNRSMWWQTSSIATAEIIRQAAVREGIEVTDAHRATLREVYGQYYEGRSAHFDSARSVYDSYDEAVLTPILLTMKLGYARGSLAEEIDHQSRNRRAIVDMERALEKTADVKVVGPPASIVRVGDVHVSRRECAKPYGGGSSVERTKLWMSGCAAHKIARTLLEQKTGDTVTWPDKALETLVGPHKPVSDDEARTFYDTHPELFVDGERYEQWTIRFLRKDDPATRRGVRVMPIAQRFADAVKAGEPFLPLARSYEASGEAELTHEVVPVPGAYNVPWEANFKKDDIYGPVTSVDGARIRWIVDRQPGPLQPFDGEAVREVMYELDKRARLHELLKEADIEVYEEGLELKWPDDRALPDNPAAQRLRRQRGR
jgi:hypothetical protein